MSCINPVHTLYIFPNYPPGNCLTALFQYFLHRIQKARPHIKDLPGHRPRACQSTYWIFLVVILLILGGPGAPWGGVFAALRRRWSGSKWSRGSVIAPRPPKMRFFRAPKPIKIARIFCIDFLSQPASKN